ncbi:MAG: hypothetical protein M3T96_07580 [Acidobacteriota bacterium]|nr:hypothetical protein [Acidobacteriota bacterium]
MENKQETAKSKTTEAENASEKGATATERATVKDDSAAGNSAKEAVNKAKDAAAETATNVVGQAKEKASSLIGEQKDNVAAGIGAVADSIRKIGEDMRGDDDKPNQIAAFAAQYGDSLAAQVENFSRYIEDRDFTELKRDAESLARRNPTLFVGGAFALGVLAARFLKSSAARRKN